MARKRRSRAKVSSGSDWTPVELEVDDAQADSLLDMDDKNDSLDACTSGVREGRFCDSFLMGTNGGATYEDGLRPCAPLLVTSTQGAREPTATLVQPEGEVHLQNVQGADDRQLIADTSMIPVRSIGLARITMESGEVRYGTAWLIGPRTLATAGHNLIHPTAGIARRVDVALAYDGKNARGGWHRAVDSRVPTAWMDDPSSSNPLDFAVLKVEDARVGNTLGWIGFADYENSKFENMILNVFGYPMDLTRYHMYGSAGRVTGLQTDRLFFDCDAGPGMSGGPVIARFGENRIAVGVHVAGSHPSNVASRINDTAFYFFEAHRTW